MLCMYSVFRVSSFNSVTRRLWDKEQVERPHAVPLIIEDAVVFSRGSELSYTKMYMCLC